VASYVHPVVQILKAVDDQAPEIARVRRTQLYKARERPAGVAQHLEGSSAIAPSVPALAMPA